MEDVLDGEILRLYRLFPAVAALVWALQLFCSLESHCFRLKGFSSIVRVHYLQSFFLDPLVRAILHLRESYIDTNGFTC